MKNNSYQCLRCGKIYGLKKCDVCGIAEKDLCLHCHNRLHKYMKRLKYLGRAYP